MKQDNNKKYELVSDGLKMFGTLILTLALFSGLSSIGSTVSYFNDTETSYSNYLKADPLGFVVTYNNSTTTQVDLSQGDVLVTPTMTPNADSELIQYLVSAVVTSGDNELCNSIHLLGSWPFPYDDSLVKLETATTTTTGSWATTYSLPNASHYSNMSCNIDLVYRGWNADVPFGKGYNDVKRFSITFFVPKVPDVVPVVVSGGQDKVGIIDPSVTSESVITEDPPADIVPADSPVDIPADNASQPPASTDNVVQSESIVAPQADTPPDQTI